MNQLRPVALLALALGLALSGCKPAPQAAPADAAAPASTSTAAATTPVAPGATTAAEAAGNCPHPVFDEFLKHFGNEIALQETSTADPLLDSHIDAEAEPEPRKVEEKVPLAKVEWPVMPDPATLQRQGRQMQVTRLPDRQVQVQMRTPDTSDQQTYTFAQKPCWQLVKREDESI
ncbi:UNVERIFIED_ORG: outer membrane receptor protein involved in Fe transport [Stenotrophomonas geniculata]